MGDHSYRSGQFLARVETRDFPAVVDPQIITKGSFEHVILLLLRGELNSDTLIFLVATEGISKNVVRVAGPLSSYTDITTVPVCMWVCTSAVQGSTGPIIFLEYLRMLTGGEVYKCCALKLSMLIAAVSLQKTDTQQRQFYTWILIAQDFFIPSPFHLNKIKKQKQLKVEFTVSTYTSRISYNTSPVGMKMYISLYAGNIMKIKVSYVTILCFSWGKRGENFSLNNVCIQSCICKQRACI